MTLPPALADAVRHAAVEAVRAYSVSRCEVLDLVAGLAPDRGEAPALTEAQRASVKHLYGELTLALRAERGEVQAKQKQLRQVKRAIGAYGRQGGT